MRMLQRNLNELGTELRRREMIEEFLSLFEKFDSYFTGEEFVSSQQTVYVILWLKIHRTFWLARGDWSKCITRPIIPQLKPGNIRENHLRDALQLSNLTSITTKFSLRWESVVWLLQTKENFCLFIKSLKKTLREDFPRGKRWAIRKHVFTCVTRHLKDNKHNSLYLALKYANVFFLGHYLFLEAFSFLLASLSVNCSHIGADNVRRQISMHIFAQNRCLCIVPTPYHRDFLVSATMIDPGSLCSNPRYGFWTRMHEDIGFTRSYPLLLQQILQSNTKRYQKQHTGRRNSYCAFCKLFIFPRVFPLQRNLSFWTLFWVPIPSPEILSHSAFMKLLSALLWPITLAS